MTDIRMEDATWTAGDATCKGCVAYDAEAGQPRPACWSCMSGGDSRTTFAAGPACWRTWATRRSRSTCTGTDGPLPTRKVRAP